MASLLERVLFHQGTKLKFTTDNRTIHFECASENYMPIPSAGVEAAYRSKTFFMIAFGVICRSKWIFILIDMRADHLVISENSPDEHSILGDRDVYI